MNMLTSSGIRASGSGDIYTKRIVLKDPESYGPWKTKITSILDAEDCWSIVDRSKVSPTVVGAVPAANGTVTNQAQANESRASLKDYNKGMRKATSMITQTVDDSIVMSLAFIIEIPELFGISWLRITTTSRLRADLRHRKRFWISLSLRR